MKSSAVIGLLGLGEYSTKYYADALNQSISNDPELELKIHQVDFEFINEHLPFGFEILKPIVEKHILDLYNLGVNNIVIPNMTLHLTVDRINLPARIKDKIIHPFKETIQQLKEKGIQEITLLGTRHTMQSDLIQKYFKDEKIDLHTINQENLVAIDELRMKVYEQGASDALAKELNSLSSKYPNPVLMCTELSLINSDFIDAVKCQIQAVFVP